MRPDVSYLVMLNIYTHVYSIVETLIAIQFSKLTTLANNTLFHIILTGKCACNDEKCKFLSFRFAHEPDKIDGDPRAAPAIVTIRSQETFQKFTCTTDGQKVFISGSKLSQ